MIKDFFKKVKIFLYGIITGIITAIMSYLYIKNQKVIKKIIKIKRGKNENNNNIQSQNRRQRFEREESKEWRPIRQSDRGLGRGEIVMEGSMQCGQLEQTEQKLQNRDYERELLGNNGAAQGKIQGDINNKSISDKSRLDKTHRDGKNINNNSSQPEVENKKSKIHKHS